MLREKSWPIARATVFVSAAYESSTVIVSTSVFGGREICSILRFISTIFEDRR